MSKRVVYITEEQEHEISRRIMSEALVVNSSQVSDIVNYLNRFFVPGIDYAGDVGTDGLPCSALEIVYTVNGQQLQKLKRNELLDVVDNKFRGFVKDNASRRAYFSKVIDDWLNGKVQKTGQITVNVISDKDIENFNRKDNNGKKRTDGNLHKEKPTGQANEATRRHKRGQSLLLEGDSRLKQVEAIIRSEFQGLLDPDATVTSGEYQVNGNPNTTWLVFLTYSLRHEFGLMTNADVKYLPLVAKLAFSDEVGFQKRDDNGRELGILKRIVAALKKDDSLFQKVKSVSPSFSELYNALKSQLDSEMQAEREAADSVEEHGGYEIVDVPDFKTANFYGNRSCSESKLCYTQNKDTWNNWTNDGLNRAYVCLRDGWENEPEEPTEGNPYDSYGTSMIFAFVSPEGRLVKSNCRWNHHTTGEYGPGGCDQAFTEETLARTVGRRFTTTFLPWPPEKLRAMGYVSFEDAERRVMAGEDPRDVFDECGDFHEGYAVVGLNGKRNFIGTDGRFLSPNQWFDWCGGFSEGYAVVELNRKWNFIGTDGELLWKRPVDQWFDVCGDLIEGYARVKLNGKYNFINTNGEFLWKKPLDQWFDGCGDFREGYAIVVLNGKCNFIGTDGELLWKRPVDQWFDWCGNFVGRYAAVLLGKKKFYLGKKGKLYTM